MQQTLPKSAGIGLRPEHYSTIIENKPDTVWFEILTENYMGEGGLPLLYLDKIRANYPISFHGVGMSLASADPLNMNYMLKLKKLIQRFQPLQVSDHMSWVSVQKEYAHELLPFPYYPESLQHITDKISRAQDFLQQQILIENPSSYMLFDQSIMSEWDFINQLIELSGCKLLLDVNNIHVSAFNTGFNARDYIQKVNKENIAEIHLAGFADRGSHLYDTHGAMIHQDVWSLYEELIHLSGPVPTLIEWDTDIPEFSVLCSEADKAQQIINQYSSTKIISRCVNS